MEKRSSFLMLITGVALLMVGTVHAQEEETLLPEDQIMEQALQEAESRLRGDSLTITLEAGRIQSVAAEDVIRVAIGNPQIADVSVVSTNELLLQAKTAGSTNLIIWDRAGQRVLPVEVLDKAPETTEQQLGRLLSQTNFPGVEVRREDRKIFVVGTIERQEDMDRLEQVLSSFPDTANLVELKLPAVPQEITPPLVGLSVQVVELNRSDLERLGVNWSNSIAFTEPSVTDLTWRDSLMKFGTSLTRSSFSATLNALVQQNRARLLAEPKLVTASGKEASSFVGLEVPILAASSTGTGTGTVTANVEFKQTGVTLKMTPVVQQGGKITTKLEAEVSGIDTASGLTVPVGSSTVLVPGFKVRKAHTEVTTESGESIVIAGLLESEDNESASQVPGLGSIPVFGRLFRSPEIKATQRELVITVTPELLRDSQSNTERRLALEQAVTTAGIDDPKLRYALLVQERIARAIQYPSREHQLNLSGTVKLRLRLFSDGSLGEITVSQSSGIQALDSEALHAAKTQAPYPTFPSQLAERELWLEVPVAFHL